MLFALRGILLRVSRRLIPDFRSYKPDFYPTSSENRLRQRFSELLFVLDYFTSGIPVGSKTRTGNISLKTSYTQVESGIRRSSFPGGVEFSHVETPSLNVY